MKHAKYLVPFLSLLVILFTFLFNSCGTDTTTNNTSAGGWPPTFSFKTHSIFSYTTDSIDPSGSLIHIDRPSTDTVQDQTQISGQNCFPFRGTTHDVATNQTSLDQYYVRYDPAGYYYQYGIKRLIDTNLTPSWDLIGDFTKARQTTYNVGSINYTVTLPPPLGTINFTGPLTGQIADSTSIQTTSPTPQTIYCYRILLHAHVSGPYSGQTVTGDIDIDYYVGYTSAAYPNNPAGLVELISHPFHFTFAGQSIADEPGFDRKLFTYTP